MYALLAQLFNPDGTEAPIPPGLSANATLVNIELLEGNATISLMPA